MSTPAVLDTPEEWSAEALELIQIMADLGMTFTADDLRREMRPAPHPNLVGAVFRTAYQRRWITQYGTALSSTPSRRGGLVRQWVGVGK